VKSSLLTTLVALALAGCSGAQTATDTEVSKSDFHYRLARNYYNDRNIAMTQRELHESLRLDPANAEALHLRGFVLMGLNDLPGAAASLSEALRVKPDLQEARNNLGTVLMAQGRWAEAVEIIKPLLEDPLYPTPAFAHGNVGWAYFQAGDLPNARKHLDMSVFLNPRFCLGWNFLGLLHMQTKNPRAAREAFEKAVKVCPKYAEPWYYLGVMHQQEGDGPGADAAFAKCAEAGEDTPIGKRCKARR